MKDDNPLKLNGWEWVLFCGVIYLGVYEAYIEFLVNLISIPWWWLLCVAIGLTVGSYMVDKRSKQL